MLGYSGRRQGCQEGAAWQARADTCRCWASPAEGGRVPTGGVGVGAACTQVAGEGTAPRWHGGTYLWGWGSQRQDSDRMGQSLGLCLLRLIPVLQLPHRGLLAAACPQAGSVPVTGGAELGRGLTPSWEG